MTFYVQFQGMSGMSGSRNLRRLQLVLFQHGFLWQEALDLLAQRARLLRHVTLWGLELRLIKFMDTLLCVYIYITNKYRSFIYIYIHMRLLYLYMQDHVSAYLHSRSVDDNVCIVIGYLIIWQAVKLHYSTLCCPSTWHCPQKGFCPKMRNWIKPCFIVILITQWWFSVGF